MANSAFRAKKIRHDGQVMAPHGTEQHGRPALTAYFSSQLSSVSEWIDIRIAPLQFAGFLQNFQKIG
jgi:hypothetical protein